MKQIFDQLLKFLHEGISAIFRFVELIWMWSVDQIAHLASVPWQQWPEATPSGHRAGERGLGAVRVGRELFYAGAAILAAFAELLGVLVRTLPHVMLAGIIALGGVWVINHLDNSLVRMPSWLQASDQTSTSDRRDASDRREASPPAPSATPQEQK